MSAAFLAADAAAQGDRELPTFPRPRKVPAHVIDELRYTAQLLQRAEKAVTAQLDALRADGVYLDGFAARAVCFDLVRLSALASLTAMQAMEADKNGL